MMSSLFSTRAPSPPPTSEDDRLAWLRLIRSYRVGCTTFHRLLLEHGSAQAALAALPGIAEAAGVTDYAPCTAEQASREMAAARRVGAQMICHGTPAYPLALTDLADAPPVLWTLGDARLLARPMIAMVGARNASSLGLRMARKLAEGLAEAGYAVVSGLARGIDAAAHEATLSLGTIAVMAGGVDVMYPVENEQLAAKIATQGLRLSEQPIGLDPQARHFPIRNRIISGLSQAVIVVEAAARSGSLITARNALDQGRDVMAVPGHPFDARASGCNMLIRDGATLIRSVEDVMEALAPARARAAAEARAAGETRPATTPALPEGPRARSLRETSSLHSDILARLGPSPTAEDQLIRDLNLPAAQVAPELLNLELDGRIIRQAGGLLSRVS